MGRCLRMMVMDNYLSVQEWSQLALEKAIDTQLT